MIVSMQYAFSKGISIFWTAIAARSFDFVIAHDPALETGCSECMRVRICRFESLGPPKIWTPWLSPHGDVVHIPRPDGLSSADFLNVGKTQINHPFGNCLCYYWWFGGWLMALFHLHNSYCGQKNRCAKFQKAKTLNLQRINWSVSTEVFLAPQLGCWEVWPWPLPKATLPGLCQAGAMAETNMAGTSVGNPLCMFIHECVNYAYSIYDIYICIMIYLYNMYIYMYTYKYIYIYI